MSLTQTTLGVQCLSLRTSSYNFSVRYIKDSTNHLANCLSRLGPLDGLIMLQILQVHEITSRLPATVSRIELLCDATAQANDL